MRPKWPKFLIAPTVLVVAAGTGYNAWNTASAEHTCVSCHEIRSAYDTWVDSAHRKMACSSCHGTAASNGLHSLREKAAMVLTHFSSREAPEPGLREDHVLEIMDRCVGCHRSQQADWQRSGHSATYAAIFLDQKHNRAEKLYPDCLKCHGMFFDGNIDDLMEPLDTRGPWRLKSAAQAGKPVIPCLACHHVHARGETAAPPDYSSPQTITSQRRESPSPLVWYDRYSGLHLNPNVMLVPPLYDGTRVLKISEDHRQHACMQCHAPDPERQSGTSDDRTPKGVHEGISCLSCHSTHSQETRQSCGQCHPAISNCGLDVNKMDTTFRDRNSKHNIHFVKCTDCHPRGTPLSKRTRERVAE